MDYPSSRYDHRWARTAVLTFSLPLFYAHLWKHWCMLRESFHQVGRDKSQVEYSSIYARTYISPSELYCCLRFMFISWLLLSFGQQEARHEYEYIRVRQLEIVHPLYDPLLWTIATSLRWEKLLLMFFQARDPLSSFIRSNPRRKIKLGDVLSAVPSQFCPAEGISKAIVSCVE